MLPGHLDDGVCGLSLIHISEPTRQAEISYAVFCLKKKKKKCTKNSAKTEWQDKAEKKTCDIQLL